ncbi:unnamed protein product [Owenia fusiformis]|uniref:Large ribosomal subunit protein uL14m n=1 Tax=Owenia fusiformis TaxID=6347 RepID=A0A8S4PFG0_OWEFU|nr:unnamed protein product [Owenia fusiformis]
MSGCLRSIADVTSHFNKLNLVATKFHSLAPNKSPKLLASKPPEGASNFSSTSASQHIMKLTRMRVVDNSALGKAAQVAGKPPRVIHVYKKTGIGHTGDKVLLAIRGQKTRGYIVGCKGKRHYPMKPRFDTNNVVLVDDNGNPLGTRIKVPIGSHLRANEGDFTKLLAIATKFV